MRLMISSLASISLQTSCGKSSVRTDAFFTQIVEVAQK